MLIHQKIEVQVTVPCHVERISMKRVYRINLSIRFSSKNETVNHDDDRHVFQNPRSSSMIGTILAHHTRVCYQPIGMSEALCGRKYCFPDVSQMQIHIFSHGLDF